MDRNDVGKLFLCSDLALGGGASSFSLSCLY